MAVPNVQYRFERKYLVDRIDHQQAIALLHRHPAMFYAPYPPRYINNFYLDTVEMDNYHDNVNGAGHRRKVRVRWYGELFKDVEQPVLEFKIKHGTAGLKRNYPFPAFELGAGFSQDGLSEKVSRSDLPPEVKRVLRQQDIVLLNRYFRYYYATRDEKYRVTVDTGMSYYHVGRFENPFIHRQVDHRHIVVELKYDQIHDKHAQRVSSRFPFRVTKSSKYVQGIERVYF